MNIIRKQHILYVRMPRYENIWQLKCSDISYIKHIVVKSGYYIVFKRGENK